MKNMFEKVQESVSFIKEKTTVNPEIGLILGSGLGILADEIENPVKINYNEIPNFPVSTVEGHAGCLVIGTLEGKQVVAMQGRFHYYEGYSQREITFPVRVMKALGVETIVVTNAAGGSNKNFKQLTESDLKSKNNSDSNRKKKVSGIFSGINKNNKKDVPKKGSNTNGTPRFRPKRKD